MIYLCISEVTAIPGLTKLPITSFLATAVALAEPLGAADGM